jgi:hypothetical protein
VLLNKSLKHCPHGSADQFHAPQFTLAARPRLRERKTTPPSPNVITRRIPPPAARVTHLAMRVTHQCRAINVTALCE